MKRQHIAGIYASPESFGGQTLTVCGWARTIRDMKNFGFIELNDGTLLQEPAGRARARQARTITTRSPRQNVGAAFIVHGELVLTPDAKQPFELKADRDRGRGRVRAGLSRCRKSATAWNSCAPSSICARARTSSSAAFRVRSVAALRRARVLPGARLRLCPHPHHHRLLTARARARCSRSRRWTSNNLPQTRGRQGRLQQGLLRQDDEPDRLRPAQRRELRHGLRRRLHLRPDLPRRELQHPAPRRRVLDDRAGDGLCRPRRTTWTCAEAMVKYIIRYVLEQLPGGDGVLQQLRGQGPAGASAATSWTPTSAA